LIDWQQTCKQLYFGMRLVYGGGGLGLDGDMSTHAPTSPSLLNTHEISYPHPTPTPLHHTQYACQSIAAYKFCCQSVNLKMAIRAETCNWYLCNKQHISNHQVVVFDSWLIQLQFIKTQRGWRTIWTGGQAVQSSLQRVTFLPSLSLSH
jgi:hypothetical protein